MSIERAARDVISPAFPGSLRSRPAAEKLRNLPGIGRVYYFSTGHQSTQPRRSKIIDERHRYSDSEKLNIVLSAELPRRCKSRANFMGERKISVGRIANVYVRGFTRGLFK